MMKVSIQPGWSSSLMAHRPAHGDILLWHLEVYLVEEKPAFLEDFAPQGCLPRNSANQSPKQVEVCPFEVHGSSSADHPLYFSHDCYA
ncbi:hypothetical protein AV530_004876 [Patagioenas fasciata monilis]|uniref:Uncharacterized protein n=1 Tax=Patagioenas fasciata monilis TaxID=372326 RepID=A0A1V4JTR8_PATFA|nr:hypothetical protein AV530_004876 [Patagioenas fasciata monilis]